MYVRLHGRYAEAHALCSAALHILEQAFGERNLNVATALMLQVPDPKALLTLHDKPDLLCRSML